MNIRPLDIEGVHLLEAPVHADHRGWLAEWFRGDRLHEATGASWDVAQANVSVSGAGTVRGVHFTAVPPGQAKVVHCMHGAIFDVAVDVREGSPTYGTWTGVRLEAGSGRSLCLAAGLGHAFMALEDHTVVSYLCSTTYRPGREHGVSPLDAALGIAWPDIGVELLLSEKDRSAPTLDELRTAGLLPTFPG